MDQSKNMVTILLAVVAVLLAAIAGLMVYQNMNDTLPAPTVGATDSGATVADPSMPTVTTPVEFDPETAPVVPEGQTPEEFVTTYYELCQASEYEQAYYMLPVDKQQYYGDVAGFGDTLASYGITSFAVEPQVESDGVVKVVGTQEAQGMGFPYTWTFVEGEDGSWLCQSREMGGL